jgi:hypothetical protein
MPQKQRDLPSQVIGKEYESTRPSRKREIDDIDEMATLAFPDKKRSRHSDRRISDDRAGEWTARVNEVEGDTIFVKSSARGRTVPVETVPADDYAILCEHAESLDDLLHKERSQKHTLQKQRDKLEHTTRQLQIHDKLQNPQLRELQAEVERLRAERSAAVLLTPQASKTDEEHYRSFASLNQKIKDLAQHLSKTYPAFTAETTSGLRRREYAQWWLSKMLKTVVFDKYLASIQMNVCRMVTKIARAVPDQRMSLGSYNRREYR